MSGIDVLTEKLVLLAEIAHGLPVPPSSATLSRWHSKGVNGTRLATVLVGRRRYTTKAAFAEFIRAQSGARGSLPSECD